MRRVILYILLITFMVSCKEFTFPTFRSSDDLLAKVGSKRLYMDQVDGIFSENMSHSDSLEILKAHVESWVIRQIKISEAEKLFQKDEDDIKKLLDNYYNSLLIYKYDEYISAMVDTTVTMPEMLEYYADNRDNFRLSSPIVKAKLLTIPSDYREPKELQEILCSKRPEAIFDLIDLASKNNLRYEDFTSSWSYLFDVTKQIPFTSKSVDDFADGKRYYEVDDGVSIYMMSVEDYRSAGEYAPLEMVESSIKRAINTLKRNEKIAHMCDSSYNALKSEEQVEKRLNMLDTILSSYIKNR